MSDSIACIGRTFFLYFSSVLLFLAKSIKCKFQKPGTGKCIWASKAICYCEVAKSKTSDIGLELIIEKSRKPSPIQLEWAGARLKIKQELTVHFGGNHSALWFGYHFGFMGLVYWDLSKNSVYLDFAHGSISCCQIHPCLAKWPAGRAGKIHQGSLHSEQTLECHSFRIKNITQIYYHRYPGLELWLLQKKIIGENPLSVRSGT